MHDPETEVAAASFDPNMPESGNLSGSNFEENLFSLETNNTSPFNQIDHKNFNDNNLQEIDSNSTALKLQNLSLNNNAHDLNNCTTTNIHNVSHEMGYPQFDENIHTTTSDRLTLLHIPRCSFASSSTTHLPPPIPSISFAKSSSLFGQMDENGEGSNTSMNMNGIAGIYQDGKEHLTNPDAIFEFSKGASLDDEKLGKAPKYFDDEKQRRQYLNDQYQQLRSLFSTPTAMDRASILSETISYINELKRIVAERKLLVEKKRISKERNKRLKIEDNNPPENGGEHNNVHGVDGSGSVKPKPDEGFEGSTAPQLRTSWLQRKCKDTEVVVQIVDDNVTIKLIQRKKMNCLMLVSRTLDDLQLDLRHVGGGHDGDYYSYLFNSKICEGSSVNASAIANKLIEVVERQYAAASVTVAPTTSF